MPSPSKSTMPSVTSRRLLACGFLLLAAALGVRILISRRGAPAAGAADIGVRRNRTYPQSGEVEANIAHGSALQQAGRLDEARQAFSRADRLDPHDPRPAFWLGMISVQQHKLPD